MNTPTMKMTTTPTATETRVVLEPTYKENFCFLNALINQQGVYKEKNLKIVVGSLGLNGWYEFGGKDWDTKKFMKKLSHDNVDGFPSIDAHCWLEDEKGNVYDYIFENYDFISQLRTGKQIGHLGLMEKKTPKFCKMAGLHYLPASQEAQTAILDAMLPHMLTAKAKLETGRGKWVKVGGKYNLALATDMGSLVSALL